MGVKNAKVSPFFKFIIFIMTQEELKIWVDQIDLEDYNLYPNDVRMQKHLEKASQDLIMASLTLDNILYKEERPYGMYAFHTYDIDRLFHLSNINSLIIGEFPSVNTIIKRRATEVLQVLLENGYHISFELEEAFYAVIGDLFYTL